MLFLIQACGNSENIENQAINDTISEDALEINAEKSNNPPPGDNNQPNNPPPGENNQPPPPGEKDIDRALQILEDANDDILDCINRELPTDVFQRIVNDLNPDNYEAEIIIACFEDPGSSKNTAQPPPGKNNQGANEDSTSQQSSNQSKEPEGNQGNSWYSLNVYEYTTSYSPPTSNSNTGFGLNESGDILLSGYGFNDSGGSTKLNHPVSISANYGKLAVTDRFNN